MAALPARTRRTSPARVRRACLRKVLTLLARSSPKIFEEVEALGRGR